MDCAHLCGHLLLLLLLLFVLVVNSSMYEFVDSASNPSWMRSVIATRVAHNGPEWIAEYSKENSGTYNNQWSNAHTEIEIQSIPQVQWR
jgi:hypothetical protein